MNSRTDVSNKELSKKVIGSRTEKNKNLYSQINREDFSRVRTNDNVRVIDDQPKEIDIEKIKDYINKMNDEEPRKKKVVVNPVDTGEIRIDEDEEKVYDINTVLEKAKEEKQTTYENEKHRRLRDTGYDILNRIELEKSKENNVSEKNNELLSDEDVLENEKTLMDLINTVTIARDDVDLLSELTESENKEEEKTDSIEKEIEKANEQDIHISKIPTEAKQEIKVIEDNLNKKENEKMKDEIDKSFYTNSMSFSKKDFEGFEDIESSVKKNNVLVILAIIMLIIVIGLTAIVICNYVFEIGWF